jgi:hypothetical protein
MKLIDNSSGTFFVAVAPYNRNSVIILDTGEYGCLKAIANADKYFNTYYPECYRIDTGMKKTKVSKTILKDMFISSLKQNYKWTTFEREELARYFNIKLDRYLSESKTCARVKGYKKPTTGKRIKTYARKKK